MQEMRRTLSPVIVAFFLVFLFLASCTKDETLAPIILPQENPEASSFSSEVVLEWYLLFEEIDRYATGFRPPASARALAYIGLAGYEAAVPGMLEYNSFGNFYQGLDLPNITPEARYHWPIAVNAAYFEIIKAFYPHLSQELNIKIADTYFRLFNKWSNEVPNSVAERSKNFGAEVGQAVYEWSSKDLVGHEAYLRNHDPDYIPPDGEGLWHPTAPDFTPALFPFWGEVRTFAMAQRDLIGQPHLPYSTSPNSQFYLQAKEVQVWADEVKAGNDQEGKWMGEFWSDDVPRQTFTPPGRWIAIANQILEIEGSNLDEAVILYAQIGMALCDAGIAVWKSKFHYNLERPIDYIRRNINSEWTTNLNNYISNFIGKNPNFPAYPSGHAGFGAAAAYILAEKFGNNYSFTDFCHQDRTEFIGTPRSFKSFTDMAYENGLSRIPLGVHFRMDSDEGLRLGYLAGEKVLDLPWLQ